MQTLSGTSIARPPAFPLANVAVATTFNHQGLSDKSLLRFSALECKNVNAAELQATIDRWIPTLEEVYVLKPNGSGAYLLKIPKKEIEQQVQAPALIFEFLPDGSAQLVNTKLGNTTAQIRAASNVAWDVSHVPTKDQHHFTIQAGDIIAIGNPENLLELKWTHSKLSNRLILDPPSIFGKRDAEYHTKYHHTFPPGTKPLEVSQLKPGSDLPIYFKTEHGLFRNPKDPNGTRYELVKVVDVRPSQVVLYNIYTRHQEIISLQPGEKSPFSLAEPITLPGKVYYFCMGLLQAATKGFF